MPNAIDNTNLLEMNAGIGTIGFTPVVTYVYDAGAKTVAIHDASVLQAGDAMKEVKIRVHDFFGKEVRDFLRPSGNGGLWNAVPNVVFGGSGVGAVAHAVLTAGVITSIVIDTPGTGYTDGDPVYFEGAGGGARGTLLETGGAVDSVALTANDANDVLINIETLDASKQLAISVTYLTTKGLVADGGAYGLMAAGNIGHWDKQLNAQP